MNLLFPPEIRTASVVPRWSIVRAHQQDFVSNHSYFVIYYALQIARLIEWGGPQADLMFYAWAHDCDELITGDMVSPVKAEIIDPEKTAKYVSDMMRERLPGIESQLEQIIESPAGDEIQYIVKVADRLDACLFLITELNMGNKNVGLLYQRTLDLTRDAWDVLCASQAFLSANQRDYVWDNEIFPAIQSHFSQGGTGL